MRDRAIGEKDAKFGDGSDAREQCGRCSIQDSVDFMLVEEFKQSAPFYCSNDAMLTPRAWRLERGERKAADTRHSSYGMVSGSLLGPEPAEQTSKAKRWTLNHEKNGMNEVDKNGMTREGVGKKPSEFGWWYKPFALNKTQHLTSTMTKLLYRKATRIGERKSIHAIDW